jgi:RimJ/RimL family protein N-acetyltransferase
LVFLERFISDIRKGRDFKLEVIDESKSLYLPRLSTIHHGWIDWQSWSGSEIEAFIRSFDKPYIGASTCFRGKRVFLHGARMLKGEKGFHPFQSGLIVRISDDEGVVVATSDGELAISNVVDELDNDMILNLTTGIRFFTHYQDIVSALEYEASYAPTGLNDKDSLYHDKTTVLKGDNVFLRPLEAKDCSIKYVDWLNDPEVNKYLESRWSSQNRASVKAFIQDIADSNHSILFGIFLNSDSSHIGNVKIGPIDKYHLCADIGYLIGERTAWGYGYATEAVNLVTQYGFKVLKLNKCTAGVYENNLGSCRVLEKAGYSHEGCSKNQLKVDNGWEDHLFYGMLNIVKKRYE